MCVVLEMCLGNVPHETGMEGPKFRAAFSFLLGRVGVSAVAIGPWEVRGASPAEPVEEKPESLAQFLKVLLLFFFCCCWFISSRQSLLIRQIQVFYLLSL